MIARVGRRGELLSMFNIFKKPPNRQIRDFGGHIHTVVIQHSIQLEKEK
jgi:hypothetical protein